MTATRRESLRPSGRGGVQRLSTASSGKGWTAELDNALTTARPGESVDVPVYVTRVPGASQNTVVTLTATSESDPTATRSLSCTISVRETSPNR
ncbi:hypothetical protein [Streptosporangium sp. NPDC087985]|uniref:hypothetical protein n=1 Tax=Streptosporangium sp. NPDC087985 TaxID=3366196 RepID=UPI00381AE487